MRSEREEVRNKNMNNKLLDKVITKLSNYFSPLTSHFPPPRGYTLVELLSVIGILSVIGVIVVTVTFITLRGAQKSDVSELVRQNGDAALSQMVRTIRYAKSLDAPRTCTTPATVQTITVSSLTDGDQTTYSCENGTIASNSASLLNTNAVQTTACSFTCSQTSLLEAPTVTIQFSLSAKSTGSFVETNASIPFTSSVTLRNYSR